MIKIYGSSRSSAGRCYVMLEECGLKFQVMPMNMKEKQHKSPEYLRLNPNGKIPTLVDGDFVIWESMAINRYLAEKYKPELLGATIEDRGLIEQWSVWSMIELQPPLVDMLIQLHFVPEGHRDMALVEKCRSKLPDKFAILDGHLRNREHIVSNYFSLADLNVASVVNIGLGLQMDLSAYPHMSDWLKRMKERRSFKAAAAHA